MGIFVRLSSSIVEAPETREKNTGRMPITIESAEVKVAACTLPYETMCGMSQRLPGEHPEKAQIDARKSFAMELCDES